MVIYALTAKYLIGIICLGKLVARFLILNFNNFLIRRLVYKWWIQWNTAYQQFLWTLETVIFHRLGFFLFFLLFSLLLWWFSKHMYHFSKKQNTLKWKWEEAMAKSITTGEANCTSYTANIFPLPCFSSEKKAQDDAKDIIGDIENHFFYSQQKRDCKNQGFTVPFCFS